MKKAKTTKRNKGDIIEIILQDHKPLKKLIKVLKGDVGLSEKRRAFKEFAPLLGAHAKPEEETLYVTFEDDDMRSEGFEGETEHGIADQLIEEIKGLDDTDMWMAKAKVLAELVEHHIEEEEDEIFPEYKKHSDIDERVSLGEDYSRKREELLAPGERRRRAASSDASRELQT